MSLTGLLDRALPASAPWQLVRPLGGGSEKATLLRDRLGRLCVVKLHAGSPMPWGWAVVSRVDILRTAGVPVPSTEVHAVDGGLVFVQEFLPGVAGRELTVALAQEILAVSARQAGLGTQPASGWRSLMRRSLTSGLTGFCEHASLQTFSPASRELLSRVRAAGGAADFAVLPAPDLIHFDLHLGNILTVNGRLAGIVDWDNIRTGDRLLDVAELAFMGGRFAPDPVAGLLWESFAALGDDNRRSVMLHHVALRFADWLIRHDPPDEAAAMIDHGLRCLDERLDRP